MPSAAVDGILQQLVTQCHERQGKGTPTLAVATAAATIQARHRQEASAPAYTRHEVFAPRTATTASSSSKMSGDGIFTPFDRQPLLP